MDYKKFLARSEERTLPHFGGVVLEAPDRALRLDAALAAGWYRFEIHGRRAKSIEPADPDPSLLESLPIVRGHSFGDRLFSTGAIAEPLFFLPADRPPRFSIARARRWPRGQLLFDSLDFDTEAEETARRALEDQRSLANERGIPATLRAAFGFAVASEVARGMHVPISFAEIAGRVVELAGEDGRTIAEQELHRIERERAEHARWIEHERRIGLARERAREVAAERGALDPETRAEEALTSAGAQLLDTRRLDGGLLEVTYRFMGERFLSIVEQTTLRIVDAGICLAGYDDRLTLESLPGVIREAIEDHRLVIARRDAADPMARYHWERELVDDPEE